MSPTRNTGTAGKEHFLLTGPGKTAQQLKAGIINWLLLEISNFSQWK